MSKGRGDSPPGDLVSVDPQGKVTIESGSGAGRAAYWVLKHVLLGPAITKIFRPIHEGEEHVPDNGAAIIASNHLSFADWLFMPLALDRRITFVAKSDYFTGTGVKGTLSRAWFEGLGMLPVDRDDTKAAIASLDTALEVLGRGEAFGIYPEGTRSRDGRIYRGRTGVAHLALSAGVPVVPADVQARQEAYRAAQVVRRGHRGDRVTGVVDREEFPAGRRRIFR